MTLATGDVSGDVGKMMDDVPKRGAQGTAHEKPGLDARAPVHVRVAVARPHKTVRLGAILGFAFGPLGLFYAAPFAMATKAAIAYILVAVVLKYTPYLGPALLAYLVPLVHLWSAAVGAGYAWRYNLAGRRCQLLPDALES